MFRTRSSAILLGSLGSLASLFAGCGSSEELRSTTVALGDFSKPRAGIDPDAVAMDPRVLDGSRDRIDGDGSASEEQGAAGADADAGPFGGADVAASGAAASDRRNGAQRDAMRPPLDEVRVWPVESLVGQVNGRPIYAEEFFEPIEDQLRVIAAGADRAQARRTLEAFVAQRFKAAVDSELVVAEAESKLSPEQQAGLFAWLRSLQEETIAQRGGIRAAAEASLQEEEGGSIEDFLRITRDTQLARRLLNERIEPRAIVSWRDVEQEYERRRSEFNPRPRIRIGRIRLAVESDAAAIERVKAWVAEGKDFAAIAAELKVADGGLWNAFELPENGIAGLEFSDAIKARLEGLAEGAVSRPLESRDFVSWYAVLDVETPDARSIYDPEVQLAIEDELRARRRIIERERYFESLRSRWVTDDISRIERKLIDIALQRYWQ
ncbi:MAG: hypothetical protein GC172_10885 [Phycisphaera sp.]|nr:hypothetical protein [Phycisphaera sp.]